MYGRSGHGMSPMRASSGLRLKAAITCGVVLLLYLYYRQQSATDAAFLHVKTSLLRCEQNAESVAAKLKVIYEAKKKMEELYTKTRNDLVQGEADLKKSLKVCEFNHVSAKDRLSTCERTLDEEKRKEEERAASGKKNDQVPPPGGDHDEQLKQLHVRLESIEKDLAQSRTASDNLRKENDQLKKRVADCESQLVAHVGALPKPHYAQNETAHFERDHKKDDRLEFHRDEQFQQPDLIPAKDLVRRIEERQLEKERVVEEMDKHPEDREDNDPDVVERPNPDEEDYKEQSH